MAKSLNFDEYYECPDCHATVQGFELQNEGNEEIPYVCPACGCIQEEEEVESQLGSYEEEDM